MKNNPLLPFWLITISFFVALIVPVLIQDGMFMDGVLYTSVSKNLADGIGTFWFPKFSALAFAGIPTFHEHPPLVFAIQSVFFKILGNSIYTERFYSFLTAVITGYLILLVWKQNTKEHTEIKKQGWLAILLWITIPVAFWSYQNNVQENTMGIFIMLSVYFSLKALEPNAKPILNLIVSGIFIFLATFSKGVPGFFPIGVVGLHWLLNRDISFSKMVFYTLILIGVPVLIYLLLLTNEDAYKSLSIYVNQRLLGRIASQPTVTSRFYILGRLFMELIPALITSVILFGVFKIKAVKITIEKTYRNKIIFFLLLGLSGSVPLMLTMVQKGFYFSPSLPFFGIGFALLLAPGITQLLSRIDTAGTSYKILKASTILLLSAVFIVSALQIGKASRHKNLLHDVYQTGTIVPDGSIIHVEPKMWNNWSLQCYLIRHFHISIDATNTKHDFYLTNQIPADSVLINYDKVKLDMKEFSLYQLKRE